MPSRVEIRRWHGHLVPAVLGRFALMSRPWLSRLIGPLRTQKPLPRLCSGYFQPERGQFSCLSCGSLGDSYQEEPAQSVCLACPAHSRIWSNDQQGLSGSSDQPAVLEGISKRSACQCGEGFFHEHGIAGQPCIRCPTGGICLGKQAQPIPEAGFTFSVQNVTPLAVRQTSYIIKCKVKEACDGGPASLCASGYEGFWCGECSVGFYGHGGKCLPCGSQGIFTTLNAILFLAIFPLLAFFIWLTLRDPRNASPIVFVMRLFETIGILNALAIKWPGDVQTAFAIASLVNFNIEQLRMDCVWGSSNPIRRGLLMPLAPVALVLLGLSMWPVLYSAQRVYSRRNRETAKFDSFEGACRQFRGVVERDFNSIKSPRGKVRLIAG